MVGERGESLGKFIERILNFPPVLLTVLSTVVGQSERQFGTRLN